MIINSTRFFRYRLKFNWPLKLKKQEHGCREGFLVALESKHGIGLGEAAPLPGFSVESFGDVQKQAAQAMKLIRGIKVLNADAVLSGKAIQMLGLAGLYPSLAFALESALLNLFASSRQNTILELLDRPKASSVPVNALLMGESQAVLKKAKADFDSGYRAFKLKVGARPIDEEVALVASVRDLIGDSELRLDANRAWRVDQARGFLARVQPFQVEYVEEPAENLNQLRVLVSGKKAYDNVALDESLLEINPEDLHLPYKIKAIVIKPTFLGLSRALQFATSALQREITPVFSAAFESSLGVQVVAALSGYVNNQQPVPSGLDTLEWLGEDVVMKPLIVENGRLDISTSPFAFDDLNTAVLEEIPID